VTRGREYEAIVERWQHSRNDALRQRAESAARSLENLDG